MRDRQDEPRAATVAAGTASPSTGPVSRQFTGTVEEFRRIGDRVFFALDSHQLSSSARATLDDQAGWLRAFPNVAIRIEGHCDERGTREYNFALGERRADAVRAYLVSRGVSDDRIVVVSYGKERPAVVGSNEEAWSRNRRAVTSVIR